MKDRDARTRSTAQRVSNLARERGLSRNDALTAYAMDRLLYRLGRSAHVREFFLKGGVLVANLVTAPHRFTRDNDLLRRHGPPDPDEMRRRFRDVAAVQVDDGLRFDPEHVRATLATRDAEGYDGVRVVMRAHLGATEIPIQIDIGFGDALEPPPERRKLAAFLGDDPPAEIFAYETGQVLAEKIETLLAKFPAIEHRLKDLLDVVLLAQQERFEGDALVASLRATFTRREPFADVTVLDELVAELGGKKWTMRWAVMHRENAVAVPTELAEGPLLFEAFARPLVVALAGGSTPRTWEAGGPWTATRAPDA